MKKTIKSIMLLPILAGCTVNINLQVAAPSGFINSMNSINNSSNSLNDSSTNKPTPVVGEYSIGLGYHDIWVGYSYNKFYQLDLTTAFAAFDKDGKIYDVRFDTVTVKVAANDDKTGLIVTNTNIDTAGSVTTNLELGSLHGMYGLGGSKLSEINTQIEAFADYCVGKTVDEVIASTTGGHGVAVAPELEGKVTIGVDNFEAALQYAFDHKTSATYDITGTAGVAMNSGLAYGEVTSDISIEFAGAIAKDGKVEAALLDAIDYPLTVDSEGNINPNAASYFFVDGDTTKLRSKKDLGDEYSMAIRNGGYDENCVLEWYEQAAIMEKACVGKTAAEISAFVANEGDLAGVTINVYDAIKALSKACDYAGRTVINPN